MLKIELLWFSVGNTYWPRAELVAANQIESMNVGLTNLLIVRILVSLMFDIQ